MGVEAQVLEAAEVDYIDESEVLTMADEDNHINKNKFTVPFVCGCRNLGEALRRVAEGASMLRTKGEAGTGNVVEAVRHARTVQKQIKMLTTMDEDELFVAAKEMQAPYELVKHAGGRRLDDAARHGRRLRWLWHLQERRPDETRQGHCARRGPLLGPEGAPRDVREPGQGHGRHLRRQGRRRQLPRPRGRREGGHRRGHPEEAQAARPHGDAALRLVLEVGALLPSPPVTVLYVSKKKN